jgi:uncharacterized membrane protein YidH (DUF202 family)
MKPPEDPAEDMEDMDPGLAEERTELAWNRTAISFTAVGGAVLKQTPAVGALILAMSASIFMLGRASRSGGHGRRRSLLLITVAVTALSVIALMVAVFDDGSPLSG